MWNVTIQVTAASFYEITVAAPTMRCAIDAASQYGVVCAAEQAEIAERL